MLQGGCGVKRSEGCAEPRWLVVKMDDGEADARRKPTSTEPDSVKSGRSIKEVADDD